MKTELRHRKHILITLHVLFTIFNLHATSELQQGYRSHVVAFYKGNSYGMKQCLKLCLRNYQCKSFNFNRVQLTCELMEFEATRLVKENGFTYGQKSDFPLDVPSTTAYTAMTACYITSRGNYACVVTECPHPSGPSNTNTVSGPYPRQVGGSVTFTCNYNYLPIGDMTKTCQPNGAWSDVGTCKHKSCDTPTTDVDNVDGGSASHINAIGKINVGETWTWTCRLFGPIGTATTTCQPDLTWSPVDFFCI